MHPEVRLATLEAIGSTNPVVLPRKCSADQLTIELLKGEFERFYDEPTYYTIAGPTRLWLWPSSERGIMLLLTLFRYAEARTITALRQN